MDRRYTILAILAIVLAAGLLVIPDKSKTKETSPESMLLAVNDPARFITTDDVTERIIGGDPTLQLIDVRPADQFNKFALPGAVNIPLDSVLSPSYTELLNQPGKKNVFYSNGDTDADAAWQLCKRLKTDNIYVMKGGLNLWFNTIIKGAEPVSTASGNDLDLYSFRQAARQFFTGQGQVVGTPKADEVKKPVKVNVVKKPVEESSGGGC
ncbi:MAG TPA: rhodanese-like domain-containing protein [Bacteroidales bacterium]|nr:rhodanese-like domain-containing protein [Bacteroidales bacterium]